MNTAPPTSTSRPATSGRPIARVTSTGVRTYRTDHEFVRTPVKDPGRPGGPGYCLHAAPEGVFRCNRGPLHRGRHAWVRWRMGGRVRAVWGTKDTAGAPE